MASENDILEFDLFHKLDIFKIHDKDKRSHKILRIIGKLFPARTLNIDVLKEYLEEYIFPRIAKKSFSILYVHTGVQKFDNFPGISALRSIYDAIPVNVKDNLQSVYFLHPRLQSLLFLATFGRLYFNDGLYGKLGYLSRVDYLWGHVKRIEIEVPDFVYDHDKDLEYHPMMEYGLECGDETYHRVYAAHVAMDSPSASIYSMRCIT